MFPIYPLGSNSGFTYDTLSEICPGRIRTGLAAAGAVTVVVLGSGEQPVRAAVPGEVAVPTAIGDGATVDDVVRADLSGPSAKSGILSIRSPVGA